MANLPSSSSQLALHLADRALTPILSTSSFPSPRNPNPPSQTQSQLQALSSLTTAAIAAFESASRLGLGIPQRIMIETHSSGPVILHSFLNPQSQRQQSRHAHHYRDERGVIEQAREDLRPLSGTTESESMIGGGEDRVALINGVVHGGSGPEEDGAEIEAESTMQQPPMLIASVIAPRAADVGDARRAAARLERTGREIQREWTREHEGSQEVVSNGEDG